MTDATPYPIDYDRYPRGSIVPTHVLEEASGFDSEGDHVKYRLWCLKLIAGWKRKLFIDGHGFVSIGMIGTAIKVMADGHEQVEYTRRGKNIARSMFLNRHLEQGSVNLALLSGEEAARVRREMERDSKMLAFDRPSRKLPPLRTDDEIE